MSKLGSKASNPISIVHCPFSNVQCPETSDMTFEGLVEMFEGDSADMCAGKFLLVSMGGRAEGLACADPGARTPIGASGNLVN